MRLVRLLNVLSDLLGASSIVRHWSSVMLILLCAGAANAGIPLSIIVKNYGWNAYFTSLLIACGMAILLLAPMVNLKSYVQREGAAKAKIA